MQIEGQSIFKKGIQPKWEDEANSEGGEFRVAVDGMSSFQSYDCIVSAHDTLGKFWETIVLTMIGETMDESDSICGARILDKVSFERYDHVLEQTYQEADSLSSGDLVQRLER